MTGYPRLSKLFDVIELALDAAVFKEEGGYNPLFLMLPLTDGDRWQFFGWHGDALQVDPKLGHTLIGWIKSKPPYNTAFLSESTGYWCVCTKRMPSDHEVPLMAPMPTSDVVIPEEPSKDCPF